MKIEYVLNKETCFYYWVQTESGWNNEVKNILKSSEKPLHLLAELYTGRLMSPESQKISKITDVLRKDFGENVWKIHHDELTNWKKQLESYDYSKIDEKIGQIIHFLDSNFDPKELSKVYIVQNSPDGNSAGHTLAGTNDVIFRPAGINGNQAIENAVSVIVHEYIHLIEQKTKLARELYRESFLETIGKNNISAPKNYKWKNIYTEIIAYCFTNNITGGLLSPIIHNKPMPSVEKMRQSFEKMVAENRHNTNHVISWVALNIQDDVVNYLKNGKMIDKVLIDKISNKLQNFYLTI